MSYVIKRLRKGEKKIYHAKLHWLNFSQVFFGALFFILIELGIKTTGFYAMLPRGDIFKYLPSFVSFVLLATLIIIPLISAIYAYFFSETVLTEDRVIVKKGFIRIEMHSISLTRIENIEIEQSIIARIFRAGKLIIIGTGGTSSSTGIVGKPIVLSNAIGNAMSKARARQLQNMDS